MKIHKPLGILFLFIGSILITPNLLLKPVSATEFVETFDSYQNFFKPCNSPASQTVPCTGTRYNWKESGTGASVYVTDSVHEGASGKSLTFQNTASFTFGAFETTGQNQCSTGIGLALQMSAISQPTVEITNVFTGVAQPYQVTYSINFLQDTPTVGHLGVRGSTTVTGQTSQNTSPVLDLGVFSNTKFYHVAASCPADPTSHTGNFFVITSTDAVGVGVTQTVDLGQYPITVGGNPYISPMNIRFVTASQNYYLDNLDFNGNTIGPTVVGAAATTTNTMNLVGFDTDPMRRVVIAREDPGGGNKIDTFDPDTLALQGASPLSNSCGKLDGVMAWNTEPSDTRGYAGFLDCTVSSTQSNFLKIRSPLLGDPDQSGTLCEGTNPNFCDFDLQTQSGGLTCPGATTNTLPGGSSGISNIAVAPISYTNGLSRDLLGINLDGVLLGFAFTDTGNGNVGIWAINEIHNQSPDESCGVSVPFGAPSATKQLCTWRADDGNDYMTAVSDSVSALTWRTIITRTSGDGTQGNPQGNGEPDVTINQIYPHQSPFNLDVGVACAGSYNYVLTSSGTVARIKVLGTNLGMQWQTTGASATARGIAVSRDNLRVAYTSDSTHVVIANATNGIVLGQVTIPTGGFKEMRLDDAANNLYIATGTQIARYDLAGANAGINSGNPNGVRGSGPNQCTIDATGSCPTTSGTGTSSPTAGSFFGLDPGAFDPSGKGDQTKGGFFLSLLLILAFAAVGAGIIPSRNVLGLIWGAGLGALLGFAWTIFLGVMPPVITFILIVVGIILIGFRRAGANKESSA